MSGTMAVCGFCKRGNESEVEALCGKLHSQRLVDGKVCSAHHKCMQYSALLVQYKFDSFGGFKIDNVLEEIKRGKSLKCSICRHDKDGRKSGATSGCALQSCRKTFHFYCVAAAGAVHGPFFKRLVIKMKAETKKVLYRVFCCKDHEEKYKEFLKNDLKKKQNQSSDDDDEEEGDSEMEKEEDTNRTSWAGASASSSLQGVPVLGSSAKELRVSLSPIKSVCDAQACSSRTLPQTEAATSEQEVRKNGSDEERESKSVKRAGQGLQNGDVDKNASPGIPALQKRRPGRQPKTPHTPTQTAPSSSATSEPQVQVASKKRGRPAKRKSSLKESASDQSIQRTLEEPEEKKKKRSSRTSRSPADRPADEDDIEVISSSYVSRRSGRTPQRQEDTPSLERAGFRKRGEARERPSPGQSSPESSEPSQRNVVVDVHNEHDDSSEQVALCFPLFDGASNVVIRSLVTTHFPNPQRQTFIWQDIQAGVSMTPNIFIHFVSEVVTAFRESNIKELKTLLFDKAAVQNRIKNEYSYTSKLLEASALEGDVQKHLTKQVEVDLQTCARNLRSQVGGVIRTEAGVICVLIFNEQTDSQHEVRQALFQTLPLVCWHQPFALPSTPRPTADQQDKELQKLKLWLCGKTLSLVAVFPKEDLLKQSPCTELEEFLKASTASNLEPGRTSSTAVMFHALDPSLVHEVAYIQKVLQGFLGSLPSRGEVILIIEAEVFRRNPDALKKLQKEALKGWTVQASSVFDPAVSPLSWVILVLS